MSKRDIVKVGGKKNFYAVRDKDGKFEEIVNIGDSIHEDYRTHAKKIVKPGHGHEGDLRKKK
ncbi:MAG: hypothetical protein NTY30_02950 [Candidatus Berkelbacteria bacterium]|nr:hypothetical protein [Candidatus Berkelbacteria bacterium]